MRQLPWLSAVPLAFALACAHATRPVALPIHAVTSAGGNAEAHLAVPSDWRPMVPSESRAEFLAPDHRTRLYFRAMTGENDPKACAKLAKKYAAEVIESWGGPPRTRLASRKSQGDLVDFELRRQEPKPDGEVIWSRVMCRYGALALASCTTPAPLRPQFEPVCRDVLQSLEISPRAPAAGVNPS